tara:strand:+ start:890 stop:1222 length:333 start_codon:yes stop_codon:yes gene_type:complete
MKILQLNSGQYTLHTSIQCSGFSQTFDEQYDGISLFKENDKCVTVYIPDDDQTLEGEMVGTSFRSRTKVKQGTMLESHLLLSNSLVHLGIYNKLISFSINRGTMNSSRGK